jgi:hypothetical protein
MKKRQVLKLVKKAELLYSGLSKKAFNKLGAWKESQKQQQGSN